MKALVAFALWLYPRLLRLYPRRFREEFGDEVTAVFRQHVQTAAARSGRDVLTILGREMRDWPVNLVREYIWERSRQLLLPRPGFLSGWGAVAAALPFLVYFMSFGPNLPRSLPVIFLIGGVLAAWWQRWPGWVVSWLGLLIFFNQNWLPYSLLGEEAAWNTLPRLLNMFSEVAIQTGWLAVMYFVVRRWPRYGVLVFLPFAWTPWAFSMEFASNAITGVFFNAIFLILALTAVAISVQRTTSGDIWLLYGAALLPGVLMTLGAVLFTPGMQNAWSSFGFSIMQVLAPFPAILLLQSLAAWGRENGPAAHRQTGLMVLGTVTSFMALLALNRLIGPSDLEAFQPTVGPALAAVWFLGTVLVLAGGWGLRRHFEAVGKRHLVLSVALLVLLLLIQRPSNLARTANTLVFNNPSLTTIRDIIPALETADIVLLNAGFVGLLLLPWTIGAFRQQTAAFPVSPTPSGFRAWRRRWKERREAAAPAATGRTWAKRLALLLIFTFLAAGGYFFAAVFLPLQVEAEPYTRQVALGDIDGDGDLDAVLANTLRLIPMVDNVILYNDGRGNFSNGRKIIGQGGTGVVLLDSNGDGDLDVLTGGMGNSVEYINNDNTGSFSQSNMRTLQMPESGASQIFFQAGDLNNDGFADAFVAGCCGTGSSWGEGEMEMFAPVNRIFLGSDDGLVDSRQELGVRGSQAVDLGDLDGDGDLDAFVGNTQSNVENDYNNEPNEVWLNDGRGNFSDSGQLLGQQRTYAVALGDVDGDGDLDALVGNEGPDELWLNDGRGGFSPSRQSWSSRYTLSVAFGDFDGDGDLDALTGHQISGTFAWWRQGIIWWNDGSGRFTRGDQRIRFRPNAALAVGDVNGDGLLDIVSGALDEATVWLNDGNGAFYREL